MVPVGSRWPTDPALLFGYRRSRDHVHQGVDLVAPEGTYIRAIRPGRVILTVTRFTPGWRRYGRMVVLAHPGGTYELHAHARSLLVARGDWVSKGQPIAKVGVTRWDTEALEDFETSAPHDHVEILTRFPPRSEPNTGGIIDRIDPVAFARDASWWGALLGSAVLVYAARHG